MRRPFVLPGPDVGHLLLDRLVAEGVRYGRDFALVRIVVPLGTAEEIAPLLSAVLRDARRRTVTRRTVNYATGAKRTITLRPGRATTVTVRWVPKRGAPERATRALTRRRAA